MIRVGLVDFDTSHVVAFTQRLNHIDVPETDWVEGARVVAGCPGESLMMPERIPGYTEQLRGWGVELLERPEDLLGGVDAVMVESQQGSRHLERARPFLEAGLPTFVDKPFAATAAEADALIGLAEAYSAPLMSCSALRYDPTVLRALDLREQYGPILSVEAWTPASLHPGNPGLLHYGIHGVEVLYALMGPDCADVVAWETPGEDVVVGTWASGFRGIVRGIRSGHYGMGFAAHYERGHFVTTIEGAAFYTEMLRRIVGMFEARVAPIPARDMRGVIAFCEAALRSAQSGGAATAVP